MSFGAEHSRKHHERDLQKLVMDYLKVAAPHIEAIHIPNGGYRRKVEAAILKGMGVKAGCPDILLMWAPAKFGFIELKADGQKSRLSEHQKAFLARLADLGINNSVASSLEEVRKILIAWQAPIREAA